MNAKKQREKTRRRASKLADQAWEAEEEGNLDLALKLIRRGIELHPANPLHWNDQGMLLLQLHQDEQAAESFQAAIHLAPDFAEAYASPAAIRARQGRIEQAAILQREALRHAPSSDRMQTILAAYEALLAGGCKLSPRPSREAPDKTDEPNSASAPIDPFPGLTTCIASLDWPEIEEGLTRYGFAHVPKLLTAEQCETLRAMYDDERLFSKTVTMNRSRFGSGAYRYFGAPLPELVTAIRCQVYTHAAEIANRWQAMLGSAERFPPAWPEFHARCARAGQTTPSPLMLRYEAGGFNAPHQDIRGEVFFPLQLVIVLSRRSIASTSGENEFTGGEFLFCDQPERKPSDRAAIPASLGEAVIFCTRARLVRVGDIYGLKSAKHGLARVTSGVRYAIGIPFHDLE